MKKSADDKNDRVRTEVLHAVIQAEVSKGHLKWKVSDIARLAKVSRPLIYYHFGKTKKEILKECVSIIAIDYYGLSVEREQSLAPNEMLSSLMRTRALYDQNPSLAVFYMRARMQDTELNDQLIAIERKFQIKLQRTFPKLDASEIKALHALLHGMITAPFLDSESFKSALKLIDVG